MTNKQTDTPPWEDQPKEANNRAAVLAKIIKASKEMEPLIKGDHNPEDGYAFVSIDTYYEKAAKVAFNHGLSWTMTERSIDRRGDTYVWSYSFTVFDEEGNYINNFAKISVPHDFEGPQTSGKVVSYADKVFARQLFKLVTGEADADSTPSRKRKAAPKAKSVGRDEILDYDKDKEAPVSGTDDFDLEQLISNIKTAGSNAELARLIENNKKHIAKVRKSEFEGDLEIYQRIADARTKRIEELENEQV